MKVAPDILQCIFLCRDEFVKSEVDLSCTDLEPSIVAVFISTRPSPIWVNCPGKAVSPLTIRYASLVCHEEKDVGESSCLELASVTAIPTVPLLGGQHHINT